MASSQAGAFQVVAGFEQQVEAVAFMLFE